ncbi:endo-1,4-beta-xylanase [Paenibacillus sp. M1]|uniref:Beta-xylanase n=1 Tax=Paenibacillus haidiansis TaxID=1574488 RepID=A0ABU7VML4_9BACL
MNGKRRNRIFMKALNPLVILCLLFSAFSAAPARADNTPLVRSDFEDGTAQGWTGRGGEEVLTPVAAAARSGAYGLEVGGRTKTWHGPTLDVTAEMEEGHTYLFTGYVKLPSGSSTTSVTMSMQRTTTARTYYENLVSANASAGGWVKLEAEYEFFETADNMSVYFEIPSNATLSFYLDDFSLERLPDADPIEIEKDIPSLQDVFADDFLVGTAFSNSELYKDPDKELMIKHFNSVTPGNVLKWDSTEPEEGVFDFVESDKAVQFAVDNGMQLRGHTLVWHNQTPNWVFYDDNGNLASKELLYQRMKTHIDTVMKRYKGKIYAWDVVNEVIDTSQSDGLRRSLWYQIAGEEYIEKAFEYAHEADPDAKLFINDYNTHESAKSQALYNLIQRLQAKGVPIDGVGHQTHISLYYPTMTEIENSIIKFKQLGLETHITELDISVYQNDSQKYDTFPEDLKQKQATLYKQLFDIFKRHKDTVTNVTVWGKDDGNTWLRTFPVTRNNWPLLFDENLQSKPAYWAIIDQPAIPSAPSNLIASGGSGVVSLTWGASTGADSYQVKRSLTSGGPYTAIATVTGTSYFDSTVTNDTTYYYVVSAANAAGESANSAQVSATPKEGTTPVGDLVLQYKAGDTNTSDNQMKPFFNIKNNGGSAVNLSELTIRYWYSIDGEKPLSFYCDYAAVGSSNVNGRHVKMAEGKTGADYYLEVSFGPSAGSIAAGGSTGDIQTRSHKGDWSNFNEANDYSFDATKTSYTAWDRVTLYRNGQLIWGTEPQ